MKTSSVKYTCEIIPNDLRAMKIFSNGISIGLAIFIAPGSFPPDQFHLLRGGFTSKKRMITLCQDNGIALYFFLRKN